MSSCAHERSFLREGISFSERRKIDIKISMAEFVYLIQEHRSNIFISAQIV